MSPSLSQSKNIISPMIIVIIILVFVIVFLLKNIFDLQQFNTSCYNRIEKQYISNNSNRVPGNIQGQQQEIVGVPPQLPPRLNYPYNPNRDTKTVIQQIPPGSNSIYRRYELGESRKIGYLTPDVGDINYDLDNVLELFKARLDRSGYRYMYFTNVNGSRVYVVNDDGKMCNDDSAGCNEIYNGDEVHVLNRRYIVNIY